MRNTLERQLRELLDDIAGSENKRISKAEAELLDAINEFKNSPRLSLTDTRRYLCSSKSHYPFSSGAGVSLLPRLRLASAGRIGTPRDHEKRVRMRVSNTHYPYNTV